MIDFFLNQYACSARLEIILEMLAACFGVLSVFFSRKNHIAVYPTGIVSTGIYVYLLLSWGLVGDMLVNGYYFVISVYGWFIWSRKTNGAETPITSVTRKDVLPLSLLFIGSVCLVFIVYTVFNKLSPDYNSCQQVQSIFDTSSILPYTPYIDMFSTAIFFVAMWLMARRKLQHWHFWIVGNIISIPLYMIKGYPITSLQYIIFLFFALWGLITWNKLASK